MERRCFFKYFLGVFAFGAAAILFPSKNREGFKVAKMTDLLGPAEASAKCGAAYNCPGGGGKCGSAYNCPGGGGQCGAAYNCAGQ